MAKDSRDSLPTLPRDKPIRVAVYCRVRLISPEQASEYETQARHYQKLIAAQPDWDFAGLYIDERDTHRAQFNAMLRDAKSGKIDLIVTKSAFRFCKNSIDCVSILRELLRLKPPIGVYFETERLNTLEFPDEGYLMVLPILAELEHKKRSVAAKLSWQRRKERSLYEHGE